MVLGCSRHIEPHDLSDTSCHSVRCGLSLCESKVEPSPPLAEPPASSEPAGRGNKGALVPTPSSRERGYGERLLARGEEGQAAPRALHAVSTLRGAGRYGKALRPQRHAGALTVGISVPVVRRGDKEVFGSHVRPSARRREPTEEETGGSRSAKGLVP